VFSEISTEFKITIGELKSQTNLLMLVEGENFEEKMKKMNVQIKKLENKVS
jgi:hypothetical protein